MPNNNQQFQTTLIPGEANRKSCVDDVLSLISRPQEYSGPALITFYGSRGSGRTTIISQLQQRIPEIDSAVILGKWDFAQQITANVIEQIASSWISLPQGKTGVILIDHLDAPFLRAEQEPLFHQFESMILSAVVSRSDLLVAASSSVELYAWEDPDVKRRHKMYHILPLNMEELREDAGKSNFDAQEAMQITYGHPQVLAWWLEDQKQSVRVVTERAANFFLDDLSMPDRQFVLTASVFPQFNSHILSEAMDEEITQDSQLKVLQQIHRMMTGGLVYWDISYGYYRFYDSAVRRLLARHLLFADPDQFEKITRLAAQHFREVAKGSAFLHRQLVSAIYHTGYEYRKAGQAVAGDSILAWIDSCADYWVAASWEKVLPAWQEGAGEPAVREEIKALIGEKIFEVITHRLEALQERLRKTLKEEL